MPTLELERQRKWRVALDYIASEAPDDSVLSAFSRRTTRCAAKVARLPRYGSSDVVFYDAPERISYAGWGYVLVEAAPRTKLRRGAGLDLEGITCPI
jgi:hypothetical protein